MEQWSKKETHKHNDEDYEGLVNLNDENEDMNDYEERLIFEGVADDSENTENIVEKNNMFPKFLLKRIPGGLISKKRFLNVLSQNHIIGLWLGESRISIEKLVEIIDVEYIIKNIPTTDIEKIQKYIKYRINHNVNLTAQEDKISLYTILREKFVWEYKNKANLANSKLKSQTLAEQVKLVEERINQKTNNHSELYNAFKIRENKRLEDTLNAIFFKKGKDLLKSMQENGRYNFDEIEVRFIKFILYTYDSIAAKKLRAKQLLDVEESYLKIIAYYSIYIAEKHCNILDKSKIEIKLNKKPSDDITKRLSDISYVIKNISNEINKGMSNKDSKKKIKAVIKQLHCILDDEQMQ